MEGKPLVEMPSARIQSWRGFMSLITIGGPEPFLLVHQQVDHEARGNEAQEEEDDLHPGPGLLAVEGARLPVDEEGVQPWPCT